MAVWNLVHTFVAVGSQLHPILTYVVSLCDERDVRSTLPRAKNMSAATSRGNVHASAA